MPRTRILAVLLAAAAVLPAQTTQGLITGRLVSSVTGRGIPGASIEYSSTTSTQGGAAPADLGGFYTLPLLSPGTYRVRVIAPGFQSQEVQEQELPVAARVELDFRLRPLSDVWEQGQYNSVFLPGQRTIVTFFGPDVDTSRSGSFEANKGRTGALESTVSQVIDTNDINYLPLEGRDVYTMLLTQPGVTSDAATGRGLGLAVNGQRPSASNFLLDGVENNNYLTTGPLAIVAPEAIQEYRISTNNFSAEYGRTSGFLANAITRAGGDRFHGTAYFYIMNDALNANTFQGNLTVDPKNPKPAVRNPFKQIQPGFFVGGPVLRNRLFFSSAYEFFRSRSFGDPFTFLFPDPKFADSGLILPSRSSYALLKQYPAPGNLNSSGPGATQGVTGTLSIRPPVEFDRKLALERFDYARPDGRDHITGRLIIGRVGQPDFIWTPYPDFVTPLHQETTAVAVTDTRTFRGGLTNEGRVSFSNDDLHWTRPHPEIPALVSNDGVYLPGSPAFYQYKNVNRSWEFVENIIKPKGRHLMTAGAGFLNRSSDGYLTAGRDGEYFFPSVISFALDRPNFFSAAVSRDALPALQVPDYNRTFHYPQFFAFFQDTWKLTSRLTLNFGLRYELFGGPHNTGAVKDDLIQLGSGTSLAAQITGATLPVPKSGDQQLFGTDKKDFAPRVGASYDLFGSGRTLLRAAYGIFYDRPFDNLWENLRDNNLLLPLFGISPAVSSTNFLAPINTELATFSSASVRGANFPDLTLVDSNLKNGYVHSYFAGVQQRVSNALVVEINGSGAYGRRLVTTDLVNRDFTLVTGRPNPSFPDVAYRSGQGYSDYNALTMVARYRASRGSVQATYTWSHVIDNQSEPLQGDFFNLNFTNATANSGPNGRAAFTQQYNPFADRGNSDFDQRHNFVVFSYWDISAPRMGNKLDWLLQGWRLSELAAFRSGFPYNIIGPTNAIKGQGLIADNRVDLINPSAVFLPQPVPVAGGERLLNKAAFAPAPISTLGNLGRNALSGPGFYNVDLSLSRSFGLRRLGEGGRFTVRADAFNILNHANLGNPVSNYSDPNFGVATFGRQGTQSGFPASTPLNETPRQVQLSLKVTF